MISALAALATAVLAAGATADPPRLDLPIDCTPGETCWLVNFVDREPGPDRADFRCGAFTYDGHKGTDIAIAGLDEMRRGVTVKAAAPGRVLRIRDGLPDVGLDGNSRPGRDCGNGVVVDHGSGWTTQYCHLKSGSVAVAQGSAVVRGQRLGEVGLSGRTEFPHVHVAVRRDTTVIDPFTGDTEIAACDPADPVAGLWSPEARRALGYPGPQPYLLGFANAAPKPDDARAGRWSRAMLDRHAPAIVFWADTFTVKAGDRVRVRLTGPDGAILADDTETVDRPLARLFRFAGRRNADPPWPVGVYRGRVEIIRGDDVTARSAEIDIR